MCWKGWGKNIITSNPKISSSGWRQIRPWPIMHFNKPWRLTHEKVTPVDHDPVLSDPHLRAGGSISVQNPFEQCAVLRHGLALPDLTSADDEIHGTRAFVVRV